jgi:hypothetical protein
LRTETDSTRSDGTTLPPTTTGSVRATSVCVSTSVRVPDSFGCDVSESQKSPGATTGRCASRINAEPRGSADWAARSKRTARAARDPTVTIRRVRP